MVAGQGQRKKLDNEDGPFSAELAYTKGWLKRAHTGSGGGHVSLRSSSLCVGPSPGKREGFGPQPKAFGIRIEVRPLCWPSQSPWLQAPVGTWGWEVVAEESWLFRMRNQEGSSSLFESRKAEGRIGGGYSSGGRNGNFWREVVLCFILNCCGTAMWILPSV